MTLEKLFDMGLVKDNTEIYIRDEDMNLLTRGNWYQDNVLDHMEDAVLHGGHKRRRIDGRVDRRRGRTERTDPEIR